MPTFHAYSVHLLLDDRIVGGVPALELDKNARAEQVESWIKTQSGKDVPPQLAKEALGDPDHPEGNEEDGSPLNVFKRDEKGLFVEGRQVKAMLRESAQRLGLLTSKRGTRQVIQHDIHVRAPEDTESQKLYLERVDAHGEMNYITAPDGIDERPISVMTRQGPRTAIKRSEFVMRPHVRFDIYVLADGMGKNLVGSKELANMLDLSQWLGLGADRSQGAGCFEVKGVRGPRDVLVSRVYDLIKPYEAPEFQDVGKDEVVEQHAS